MARPKMMFDQKEFEDLCKIQCTRDDICTVFNCDPKTLTRFCEDTYQAGFKEVFDKLSIGGKTSLRRTLFNMAKTKPVIAIWLSKQYLGMSDRQEISNIVPDKDITITFVNGRDQLGEKMEPDTA